jgi:hypothetical protein
VRIDPHFYHRMSGGDARLDFSGASFVSDAICVKPIHKVDQPECLPSRRLGGGRIGAGDRVARAPPRT